MNQTPSRWLKGRAMALVATGVLVGPILAGCGSGNNASTSGANLPPIDESAGRSMGSPNTPVASAPQPQRTGLSGKQKLMILAGAAAVYYLYKKNKEKHAAGQANGQPIYYLSKNGRVYYRDNTGRVHWVTPPAGGIQVPYDEAQQYSQFQGYNNQSTGRDLIGLGSDAAPAGGY